MGELREDLAQIFLESITDVETYQERHSVRSWGGSFDVRGVTVLKVRCLIPIDFLTPEQENLFGTFKGWLSTGTKVDVGRFKGLIPTRYDMVISPERMTQELRVEFICDHIEAPSGMDAVMD